MPEPRPLRCYMRKDVPGPKDSTYLRGEEVYASVFPQAYGIPMVTSGTKLALLGEDMTVAVLDEFVGPIEDEWNPDHPDYEFYILLNSGPIPADATTIVLIRCPRHDIDDPETFRVSDVCEQLGLDMTQLNALIVEVETGRGGPPDLVLRLDQGGKLSLIPEQQGDPSPEPPPA